MAWRVEVAADAALTAPLEAAVGWGRTTDEMERRRLLDPEGAFLVRDETGAVVAAGSCVTFARAQGPLAWIGGMVVHPERRGLGLGRLVLDRCLAHARARSATTIALYATPSGGALYERAGFVAGGVSRAWVRAPDASTKAPTPSRFAIYPISSCEIMDLWAYDAPRFGASRTPWLASVMAAFPERAFVAFDRADGKIAGFVEAQERFIGPLVADDPAAAAWLLHAAMRAGAPPTVFARPGNPHVENVLADAGFAPDGRSTTLMTLGESLGGRVETQYGVGALALG